MDECLYEQAISKFQHNIQAKKSFFLKIMHLMTYLNIFVQIYF